MENWASIINVSTLLYYLFLQYHVIMTFFLANINKRVFADMHGIIRLTIQIVKTFNANEDEGDIKKPF